MSEPKKLTEEERLAKLRQMGQHAVAQSALQRARRRATWHVRCFARNTALSLQ